eukprot:COSAG01_NODE_37692_length_500_cov_0.768080_1_plen_70_part_10
MQHCGESVRMNQRTTFATVQAREDCHHKQAYVRIGTRIAAILCSVGSGLRTSLRLRKIMHRSSFNHHYDR